MNLTEHFSLEELTFSELAVRKGLDNNPSPDIIANLNRLAHFLEKLRILFNKPIHINSAYRSREVNNLIGGKPTSQHCLGCAADIKVGNLTPDQVVTTVIHSDLKYDQVIREYDSWVHISIPNTDIATPRRSALIIDGKGTRPYTTT